MTRSHDREVPRPEKAEELLARWLEARDTDTEGDLEELCREHPAHAPRLRALYANIRQLERALHRTLSSLRPPDVVGAELREAEPADATDSKVAEVLQRLASRGRSSSRYAIRGEVARGGMGAILRVWDEDLQRQLAMKVVLGRQGGGPSDRTPPVDEETLSRFLAEAYVTGQLDHPGIVPLHELGVDADGGVYFTMKLVQGKTLAQVLDELGRGEGDWTQTQVLGLIQRVCDAMAYAHEKGVVHRDLKPANVMVGRFGEVYVMDWGLAKVLGAPDASSARPHASDSTDPTASALESPYRTLEGHALGTPAYMPPEQAAGRLDEVGPHSDVYAVGAMLYHLLSGGPPYDAQRLRAHEVLARVLAGPPASMEATARRQPPELVAICHKAMSREVADRYRDMSELGNDVRAFLEGRVVRAHRTGAWVELGKWVSRNKAVAATGGLALGMMFLLIVGANYLIAKRQEIDTAQEIAAQQRQEALVQDGMYLLDALDFAGASRAFEELLDENPDHPEALACLALARIKFGTADEALELLDGMPQSFARVHPVFALLRLEATGAADDLIQEAIDELATNDGIGLTAVDHYLLGILLIDRGHDGREGAFQSACMHLNRAVLLTPRPRALYHFNLAHALCHAGDYDRAEAAIAAMATLWPGLERLCCSAYSNMAKTLWDRDRFEEARDASLAALEFEGQRWLPYTHLGSALHRLGELDGARQAYEAALELAPGSVVPRDNLVSIFLERGQSEEALTHLRALVECDPDHFRSRRRLSTLHYRAGEFAVAAKEIAEAVRIDPDHFGARYDQALTMEHLDMLEAVRMFEDLAVEFPERRSAHYKLGLAYAEVGRGQDAIDTFTWLEERYPDDPTIPAHLGAWHRLFLGDLDEAIAWYRRSLEIDASVAETHCNLGSALRARGLFEDALIAIRRGHELGTQRPDWSYPSSRWLEECRNLVTMNGALLEYLEGSRAPRDQEEAALLARLFYYKGMYRRASRQFTELLREGFQDDSLEFYAACAAVQASIDEVAHALDVTSPDRAESLGEAFRILEPLLRSKQRLFEASRLSGSDLRGFLISLKTETALAPAREPDRLAELGEGERSRWIGFWEDVGSTFAKSLKP